MKLLVQRESGQESSPEARARTAERVGAAVGHRQRRDREEMAVPGTQRGSRIVRYARGDTIFTQGDRCKHIHYIRSGGVMVSALSKAGETAVIAMLGPGDFVGEGCLAGQPSYVSTAVAIRPSAVMRIARAQMPALLHGRHPVSDQFLSHVLNRNIRMEEDLTEQILGAGETRLARTLLRLAHYGDGGRPVPALPPIAEPALAEMAGTTAARVHQCLKRFKRLGFIDYLEGSRLMIHRSLLSVVLRG